MGDLESRPTMAVSSACPICNHGVCDKVTEIYFDKEKDVSIVSKWFEDSFDKKYSDDIWNKHFKEHIDPFITKTAFIRERRLSELKERCLDATQDNSTRFNLIKQMAWDFMLDIHANKGEDLETKDSKMMHQRMSKQFVDLAKMYREYYQMELEIIGMGKTEEEQREEMERFMATIIKQAIQALGEHPDAQDILTSFLNMNLEGIPEREVVSEREEE